MIVVADKNVNNMFFFYFFLLEDSDLDNIFGGRVLINFQK